MNFLTPPLSLALAEGVVSPEESIRAEAQNLRLEEQISAIRQNFFEEDGFGSCGRRWVELASRQVDYVGFYVNTVGTPHTFEQSLEPAALIGLDEAQHVVRLESLMRPLLDTGITLGELGDALSDNDADFLNAFLSVWNRGRDARPAFATFKREVADEIADAAWPDLLRDRLGLAHYDPIRGPIPVALMCYSVSEVLTRGTSNPMFTTPTALDSRPCQYFFPAPRELTYGRAMALMMCNDEEALATEILHTRLAYRMENLLAVGEIKKPVRFEPIEELRSAHLLAVQVASGRNDFC